MTRSNESFRGDRFFLSNFYEAVVPLHGLLFPTAEHAYAWHKTEDPVQQREILQAKSPGTAKRLGQRATMRSDWEAIRLGVMRAVVDAKFRFNHDLAAKLLATGDEPLVEVNYWGDTFWGTCKGDGENWLGKILMEVRATFRTEAP